MNTIELRKFDRETLQSVVQVLQMMKMEVIYSPSIFFPRDPSPLYVYAHGDRDLQIRIRPGKTSKAGKNGMLIQVYGLGVTTAVTVPHPAKTGDYVPGIVRSTCGLMARAYAAELRKEELNKEIDNAE